MSLRALAQSNCQNGPGHGTNSSKADILFSDTTNSKEYHAQLLFAQPQKDGVPDDKFYVHVTAQAGWVTIIQYAEPSSGLTTEIIEEELIINAADEEHVYEIDKLTSSYTVIALIASDEKPNANNLIVLKNLNPMPDDRIYVNHSLAVKQLSPQITDFDESDLIKHAELFLYTADDNMAHVELWNKRFIDGSLSEIDSWVSDSDINLSYYVLTANNNYGDIAEYKYLVEEISSLPNNIIFSVTADKSLKYNIHNLDSVYLPLMSLFHDQGHFGNWIEVF